MFAILLELLGSKEVELGVKSIGPLILLSCNLRDTKLLPFECDPCTHDRHGWKSRKSVLLEIILMSSGQHF